MAPVKATQKIPMGPPEAEATTLPPEAPAEVEATVFVPQRSGKLVAVLVAVAGDLENQLFPLFDGANRVGRATQCQVVLHSKRISRQHALITHRDGSFDIEPLSDRNATRVNGEQTTGTKLEDGDEIGLGQTTFRFRTVW